MQQQYPHVLLLLLLLLNESSIDGECKKKRSSAFGCSRLVCELKLATKLLSGPPGG